MCRVVSQELGGTIAAVADARGFVTQHLSRWGLESLVSDAELLTSELVTNAVRYAQGDVTVTVAVAEGVAEIGVSDRSTDLPEQRPPTWRADPRRTRATLGHASLPEQQAVGHRHELFEVDGFDCIRVVHVPA